MKYWPDGNTMEPGVLRDVSNFAPNNNRAYGRIPSLVTATSTALTTGPCLGAGVVRTLAGASKLYAGSTTKPYQANGSGGWTDRSGGTSYAATVWDFCAFGDNVVGANGNTKLVTATTGNFTSLTNSPTGAKIAFQHANAIVALGNSTDSAAWARSVTGDHTTWLSTAANDADSGTFYDGVGGPITAGGAWENLALVFKGRSFWAGIYAGNTDPSQPVIRWSQISTDVGCVSQFAWIGTEVGVVFVSERGVMLFNGNKPIPIDADIHRTFMADAMGNASTIFCTMDAGKNLVYIWYTQTGAGGTYPLQAYIWNYKVNLWGRTQELADLTGVTVGEYRTPVRNVNYRDIVAIGGLGSNSTETANLFFSATGNYLLNLSSSSFTAAAPPGDAYIRSGLLGIPGVDATIRRIIPSSDAYAVVSRNVTCAVVVYDALLNITDNKGPVLLSKVAQWDIQATGRWFEILITADTTSFAPSYQNFSVEYSIRGADAKQPITI